MLIKIYYDSLEIPLIYLDSVILLIRESGMKSLKIETYDYGFFSITGKRKELYYLLYLMTKIYNLNTIKTS